jgi:hypothetical protein
MISIIARILTSTLLYGHIVTMISTSTIERMYMHAYVRVYMYVHAYVRVYKYAQVTYSACLDVTHAHTVECTASKRT